MEKASEEIIEKLEQAVSGMNMRETVSYLARYLSDNIHSEYRSVIIETCRRILEEKIDQVSKQVMIELAEKDITDYDEVMKVALDYGLSKEKAEVLAETVRRYEEEHVFNARELSKNNFRKYCNNLLIVSGIDNVTKALIVKAGFKLKPEDNSMIVMCYIDHIYGARFYLIAPASRNEIGEIEIGERNNELSLELCLDSFDGKVEEFPGGAKVSIDMIEKIQKIVNEKKVSDGVEESRNIIGLDCLRVPGYPDDVVVYFSKSDTEYENVVCRIEDYDKNLRKFKVKILKEPVGTYGKHIGDIIEASLIITPNGQHRIYSYFNQESSNQENVKVLKPTDFLVRTSEYQCTFKNHELVQVTVIVKVLNPNEIIEAEFPAYYCRKCDRYYILEGYYSQLKSFGYICCRIDKYESLKHPDYNYFGKLNEKSILMNYGYSVEKRKELSEEERRNILAFMMDNKIIRKSKIIDYLKWFISINKNQENKQNAISKWDKDIKYVYEYRIAESDRYTKDYKQVIRRVKLQNPNQYVQTSIEDFL